MTYEVLRDRSEIVGHLRAAVQAQSRLTVAAAKRSQEHLSLILAVQPEGDPPHLLIDAYGSPGSGIAARPGDQIRAEYRHSDQSWTFTSSVLRVVAEPEPGVLIEFPTAIETLQKRRHFRVEPSASAPVTILRLGLPASDDPPEEIAERTVVVDVSAGGLGFNIDANRHHVLPDTLIQEATIDLSGHAPFGAEMIVRSLREAPGTSYRWRVGVEFQSLDASVQEAITRYVTQKEREDIRHFKRELQ